MFHKLMGNSKLIKGECVSPANYTPFCDNTRYNRTSACLLRFALLFSSIRLVVAAAACKLYLELYKYK